MNVDTIVDWYNRPRAATISAAEAIALYFQFHPRTSFVKMLPHGANLVDIGAGDGSLSIFRSWPQPLREDIIMHAYSLVKGDKFDDFASYELSDWNVSQPTFQHAKFDAILSAHFIEHIDDPSTFLRWSAENLCAGGRLYVEWPSERSLNLPSRSELLGAGVDLVISRFDDDDTHEAIPSREFLKAIAADLDLLLVNEGIARVPWLEEELMASYRNSEDRFPVQAAFWSWTGWSQFLIFEAPGGR